MNNRASNSDDPLDAEIRAALHEVQVPLQLKERLRAGLRRRCSEMPEILDLPMTSGSPDAAAYVVSPTHGLHTSAPMLDAAANVPQLAKPAKRTRRVWLSLAVAAGIGGLWMSQVLPTTGPPTQQELAAQCSATLDRLLESPSPWSTDLLREMQRLQPVFSQLELEANRIQLLGGQSLELPSPWGECTAWKLYSQRTGQDLYVLELSPTVPPAKLSGALQELQTSGQWSMAAMQSAEQVFVVASQFNVMRYLQADAFA